MTLAGEALLQGAYDIHVHCGPDVVPRPQDLLQVAADAQRAGMAGILIKDQTCPTVGRTYTLNQLYPQGPRFFSALALNLPVGGLNPYAVEAALRAGVDLIYLPTYTSRYQVMRQPNSFARSYPRPRANFEGLPVVGSDGALLPEMREILKLIAEFDAILATGHIAPEEIEVVLPAAQEAGITRMVVTHATVTLSVAQQQRAVSYGAFIEHSLQGASPLGAGTYSLPQLAAQIREVHAEHIILSSDFGQVSNGPVVAAFGRYLAALEAEGAPRAEIRTMTISNPARLLLNRRV